MSLISVEKGGPVDPDQEQREKVFRLIIIVLVAALIATFVAVVWLVQGKNSTQDDLDEAEEDRAAYAAGPDAQAAAEEHPRRDRLLRLSRHCDHEYDVDEVPRERGAAGRVRERPRPRRSAR